MNLSLPLHSIRLKVLYVLRHSPYARYTDLMRATGLESDAFKFHLRVLVENQLVKKNDNRSYSLTAAGKEFANNLDESSGKRSRSPKLSMLLVVKRQGKNESSYLFQQRKRNPFYDYWGLISAPVVWGDSIEKSAQDELKKQTGLSVKFQVQGFCRVLDRSKTGGVLLEDKLFAIVVASAKNSELHAWSGGVNRWMKQHEYDTLHKKFALTQEVFHRLDQDGTYFEVNNTYSPDDY